MVQARANGFLYKMVRSNGIFNGSGNRALWPEDTRRFEKHQRTARVRTAQPQGLFLRECVVLKKVVGRQGLEPWTTG